MADEAAPPPRPGSPAEFHIAWRNAGMTEQGEDGNPTRKVSKPAAVAMQQARSIRQLLDHVDKNLTEAEHPVLSTVQRDALTGLLSHNMNARVWDGWPLLQGRGSCPCWWAPPTPRTSCPSLSWMCATHPPSFGKKWGAVA